MNVPATGKQNFQLFESEAGWKNVEESVSDNWRYRGSSEAAPLS